MDLSGIIPPVPTPFRDKAVSLSEFRRNLSRWIAWEGRAEPDGRSRDGRSAKPSRTRGRGRSMFRLSGILVAGSNGEAPLLTNDEIDSLVEVAREEIPKGRMLMVGTGRESTPASVASARRAAERGADAILVRTPSSFRHQLGAQELVEHFEAIAAAVEIPVVLYSVPRMTGFEIPVSLVKRLASNPAFAGIKESSSNTARVVEIMAGDRPVEGDGFRVMSGDATVFYPALACGAAGGVLAVASIVPGLTCALLDAWESNDQDAARRIQKRLTPLARAVTTDYGIAGLKAALDFIGLYGGPPRRPLRPLDESSREELHRILEHALWAEDQELASGPRLGDPVEA